jgi:hypothetical protein
MSDAGVLVATITGGVSILTSIVGGLLAVVKQKKGSSITIKGDWGQVVVPADTPLDETARYVEMAKGTVQLIRVNM